jgi:taurine dioxygenase
MPGLKVRNLSEAFPWGAIVEGVDWDVIGGEAGRAELRRIFDERGLLVFRGCEPNDDFQIALSKVFGPLKTDEPAATPKVDGRLELLEFHYKPRGDDDDTGRVMVGGKKLGNFTPWHYDHCFYDQLNRSGVLRVLVKAPEGGRTGFADGIELYDRMDPELRRRIEGLNVVYAMDARLEKMRFGRPEGFRVLKENPAMIAGAKEGLKWPRSLHPAVWTRPSGEKVLHVSPWFAVGLEGHEDPEGDALLEAVCQELNRNPHVYWHPWDADDLLMWDNWRLVHCVEGVDPKYERRAQRTTILGDYGLGRFEGGKKIGEVQRELA